MESGVQTASQPNEMHTTQKLVNDLKSIIERAEKQTVKQAKAADRVIREHPYPTLGLAFGLGLLVGFLVRRK